jgi:hypothetical protein
VSFNFPLKKDLSGMGVNLRFTMLSLLSALNFCISVPISVVSNWVNKLSLSIALYSIYLVQVSHWPISIQNYKSLLSIKNKLIYSVQNSFWVKFGYKNEVFRIHRLIICYVFLNMFWNNDPEKLKKMILKYEAKSNQDI